jgi:hypothetical protein
MLGESLGATLGESLGATLGELLGATLGELLRATVGDWLAYVVLVVEEDFLLDFFVDLLSHLEDLLLDAFLMPWSVPWAMIFLRRGKVSFSAAKSSIPNAPHLWKNSSVSPSWMIAKTLMTTALTVTLSPPAR